MTVRGYPHKGGENRVLVDPKVGDLALAASGEIAVPQEMRRRREDERIPRTSSSGFAGGSRNAGIEHGSGIQWLMPVVSIDGAARLRSPESVVHPSIPVVTGTCLFLMLMYATATVFVGAAWALQSFQIGIFGLVAMTLLFHLGREREAVAVGWEPWLLSLIPVWGWVQLLAHTTASSFETREVLLRWGALAGVFYLTLVLARTREARRVLMSAYLIFATAMAVLCLAQLYTSGGRILWAFSTGYPDVYATFPSYNNYAQFIELALPIALWRVLCEGWRSWGYVLSAGILYGSVIGSASRAGAVLCTAELLIFLVTGLLTLRRPLPPGSARSRAALLLAIPVFAAIFTSMVGWERVWSRFQSNDQQLVRREFVRAAIDMTEQRPWFGYGLGTFPEVYQQFAIKDFPFYANHAHNDWAEFSAEGGVPFLLLVLIPFVAVVPSAVRHPWGLGLFATLLHACVDFPFPRPSVSGWMFMMLALLYAARGSDRERYAGGAVHGTRGARASRGGLTG